MKLQNTTQILIQDLELTTANDYPFEIDFAIYIKQVLQQQVLSKKGNKFFREIQLVILKSKTNLMLIEALFWKLLSEQFTQLKLSKEVEKNLDSLIVQKYQQIFTTIPSPKDETTEILIFFDAYICHMVYYHEFFEQRHLFNLRFIFDCYQKTIFLMNKIKVGDNYIQVMLEKIFTNNFMNYVGVSDQMKPKQVENYNASRVNLNTANQRIRQSFYGPARDKSTFIDEIHKHINPSQISQSLINTTRDVSENKFIQKQKQLSSQQQIRSILLRSERTSRTLDKITYLQNQENDRSQLHLIKKKQQSDSSINPVQMQIVLDRQQKRFKLFNIKSRSNSDDNSFENKYMKEMIDMSHILNKTKETMQDLYFAKNLANKQKKIIINYQKYQKVSSNGDRQYDQKSLVSHQPDLREPLVFGPIDYNDTHEQIIKPLVIEFDDEQQTSSQNTQKLIIHDEDVKFKYSSRRQIYKTKYTSLIPELVRIKPQNTSYIDRRMREQVRGMNDINKIVRQQNSFI